MEARLPTFILAFFAVVCGVILAIRVRQYIRERKNRP